MEYFWILNHIIYFGLQTIGSQYFNMYDSIGQHMVKYPSGSDSTSDLMDLDSADNCLVDAELDEPPLSLPPPQQPRKFNSCATVVRLNNNSIKRFSIETDVWLAGAVKLWTIYKKLFTSVNLAVHSLDNTFSVSKFTVPI